MHVKCGCNGENCKINIAWVVFGSGWKSAHWLATGIAGIFALQLLNIVVPKIHESYEHDCTVMLFPCHRVRCRSFPAGVSVRPNRFIMDDTGESSQRFKKP